MRLLSFLYVTMLYQNMDKRLFLDPFKLLSDSENELTHESAKQQTDQLYGNKKVSKANKSRTLLRYSITYHYDLIFYQVAM